MSCGSAARAPSARRPRLQRRPPAAWTPNPDGRARTPAPGSRPGPGVGEHPLQHGSARSSASVASRPSTSRYSVPATSSSCSRSSRPPGECPLDVGHRLASDSLALARSKARLASTRRSPGVAPRGRRSAPAASPPGRSARLPCCAYAAQLRLEQQRQLAVVVLDDLDRGLERLDRRSAFPDQRQRAAQQANRGREQPRVPISSTAAVSWSIAASGVPTRSFAEPSSSSTSPLDAAAEAPPAPGRARPRRRPALRARARPRPPGAGARPARGRRPAPPRRSGPRSAPRSAASGEDLRRSRVRLGALVRADVRVDGLADDRVRELEASPGLQDRERDQQVGGERASSSVSSARQRSLGEARAVAEHRDRAHQGSRRGGSPARRRAPPRRPRPARSRGPARPRGRRASTPARSPRAGAPRGRRGCRRSPRDRPPRTRARPPPRAAARRASPWPGAQRPGPQDDSIPGRRPAGPGPP